MKSFFAILMLLGAVCLAENPPDFVRYQTIIDRSPFGAVNAASAPEIVPGFAQRYQFVALVMSNAGDGPLQAVLFDRDGNRSQFRAPGETMDGGVKVVRIDQKPVPKVLLQSGLETATLTFQERAAAPVAGPPTAQPLAPMQPTGAPGQPVPPIIRRSPFRRGQ